MARYTASLSAGFILIFALLQLLLLSGLCALLFSHYLDSGQILDNYSKAKALVSR